MPRMLDLRCRSCGREYFDIFAPRMPDEDYIICACGGSCDIVIGLKPRRSTVWDKSEEIVIFRKPDGTFSFPARNDHATPPGCERIIARCDADVAKIEAMTGTRSERRWFDRGSGRDFSDEPSRPDTTEQRYQHFLKHAWRNG